MLKVFVIISMVGACAYASPTGCTDTVIDPLHTAVLDSINKERNRLQLGPLKLLQQLSKISENELDVQERCNQLRSTAQYMPGVQDALPFFDNIYEAGYWSLSSPITQNNIESVLISLLDPNFYFLVNTTIHPPLTGMGFATFGTNVRIVATQKDVTGSNYIKCAVSGTGCTAAEIKPLHENMLMAINTKRSGLAPVILLEELSFIASEKIKKDNWNVTCTNSRSQSSNNYAFKVPPSPAECCPSNDNLAMCVNGAKGSALGGIPPTETTNLIGAMTLSTDIDDTTMNSAIDEIFSSNHFEFLKSESQLSLTGIGLAFDGPNVAIVSTQTDLSRFPYTPCGGGVQETTTTSTTTTMSSTSSTTTMPSTSSTTTMSSTSSTTTMPSTSSTTMMSSTSSTTTMPSTSSTTMMSSTSSTTMMSSTSSTTMMSSTSSTTMMSSTSSTTMMSSTSSSTSLSSSQTDSSKTSTMTVNGPTSTTISSATHTHTHTQIFTTYMVMSIFIFISLV